MQLNNTQLIDRHNRPDVNQKVGLRVFFINDGVYQDPNDISGVTIFKKIDNISPSTVVDSNELIASSILSSQVLMHFGVSSNVGKTGAALDASDYNPGTQASGIYRISQGEYVVVLDGTLNLSGYYDLQGSGFEVANAASSVTDFIDVWTVKLAGSSDYKTIINSFGLYDNTFFVITQPLLLQTSNRLVNKHIDLSSIVDLKVETKINLENRDLDESIKNIFKDSVITSAQMEIVKLNEDPGLPSRVTVSSFDQTSSVLDVTPANTIIFNFDTTKLATHSAVSTGEFGNLRGNYTCRVKYTVLNQTIVSPLYHFVIR